MPDMTRLMPPVETFYVSVPVKRSLLLLQSLCHRGPGKVGLQLAGSANHDRRIKEAHDLENIGYPEAFLELSKLR